MRALALLLAATSVAASAADHPDFSGEWERYPTYQGDEIDPRYAPTPIPDPPLKPEYMPDWLEKQKILAQRQEEGQPAGDNYVHCIPDGMPAMMMGMFPMEIMQRPEKITILQEAFTQIRRIYMNEELPKWDEVNPTFYGASVGHWEGDTLVVETTGVKDYVTFRWAPHSESMKITERIRLLAPDYLTDEVTVEDEHFTRPWKWSWVYKRMSDYKMQEYVCEDNREIIGEDGVQVFVPKGKSE
ncbi:hypothetical protein GRI89_08915 [Altererythrobacter salegens]|uniref:Uncharacterized protein n=1 Tax=Croceibacterium salegens TaxID=1737568 RepID=A0A6I4SWD9_9SPHN|nr:hypothetical protein [Croceibacterium salegens]MXO59659.1 hypothetical protein [Croceibacterium salegens]